MGKKKVIFINSIPLVLRLKRSYLIEELQSNGFEVEYWDIQNLVRSKKQLVEFPDELKENYSKKMENLAHFLKELNKQNRIQTLFIVQVHERWMSRQIFYNLSRQKFYTIQLNIHSKIKKGPSTNKIGDRLKKFRYTIEEKIKVTIYLLWKMWKGYRTYGHIFGVSTPKTHSINRPDYEVFRKVKEFSERMIEGQYMVLLDIYFAQHAEARHRSTKSEELAAQYQKSMNRYFDWLEKEYKCEVIIAAHPSSDYTSEWQGRKVIKNKTAELVKDADAVIAHVSTSNVLAVLFDKPVVFIVNNAMKEFSYGRFAHSTFRQALYFKKEAYNIDLIAFEQIKISSIDMAIRMKYLYEHVTSLESENRSNTDIVIEELNYIFDSLDRGEWPVQPIKYK